MTVELVKALKLKGRLAFVEYRLEDKNVPIKLVHKMTQKQVIKEMAPHPLRYVETLNHLPWQHIIIFEKVALLGQTSEIQKSLQIKLEYQRLEGAWLPESIDLNGTGPNRGEKIKGEVFLFKGKTFQRRKNGKTIQEGRLDIDPTKTPKTLDMVMANGKGKSAAVYDLNGDTLTVCFDVAGQGRPSELKAGKNRSLVVYRRKKD